MKKPNTLPELLRHAADLDEKGEPLKGKFEYNSLDGWHTWDSNYDRVPSFRGEWRIADQDQHLLDDGWIRHTGNVCPVSPKSKVIAILRGQYKYTTDADKTVYLAEQWNWDETGSGCITHYKIIKAYVEPTTFEMRVGDKVFVLNKPYMSAPERKTRYWTLAARGNAMSFAWDASIIDVEILQNYNCWRTEADAKAYAEAKLARDKFEIGDIKC